jgi:mono/diheme cytochrome c family protein
MSSARHTQKKYQSLTLAAFFCGAIFFPACHQPGANPAVSTQPPAAAATPAAESAATPTLIPSVSPSAAPTNIPAIPTTTPPPGAAPIADNKNQTLPSLKNVAVTQPMETPKPEPTPTPAPTPEIKRDPSGKIIQQWKAPAEFVSLKNPVAARPDAARTGKYFYEQKCADCHGKDGLGNGPMANLKGKQATNLASEVVQANTDGELFFKVVNSDKERLPHPVTKERFNEEQRWYIVAYLRTLKPAKKK